MSNKEKFPVTDSVILAAIPFFGYLLVFSFEFGFSSYFQIPIEFISVSLTNLCWVTLALFVGIFFLFGAGHYLALLSSFLFQTTIPPALLRSFKRVEVIPLLSS